MIHESKRKSILFGWGISYFIILTIPLTAVLANYFMSQETVTQEIENSNTMYFDQIYLSLESQLEEIKVICDSLITNEDMGDVFHESISSGSTFKFQDCQKFLKQQLGGNYDMNLNNTPLDIFIYAKDNNYVVSPQIAYPSDLIYKGMQTNQETDFPISYDDWISHLNNTETGYSISSELSYQYFGEERFCFSRRHPLNGYASTESEGSISVSFEVDFIKQIIGDLSVRTFLVTDLNGDVLYSTNENDLLKHHVFIDNDKISMDGTDYVIRVKDSTNAPWQYVLLTSDSLFTLKSRNITVITIVILIITLILGILIISILLKRNYSPIKNLIRLFQNENPNKLNFNFQTSEFHQIHHQYTKLSHENENIQERLNAQVDRMNEMMLFKLLSGVKPTYKNSELLMKLHEKSSAFGIVSFVINQEKHDLTKHIDIYSYALNNAFCELVGDHYEFYKVDTCDSLIYIFALPDKNEEEWQNFCINQIATCII